MREHTMAYVVVERYISNKVKKNSLTIVEKYPFDDYPEAAFFASNLKRIDGRVINYRIEK
jgi:hypothetical protein